MEQPKMIDHLFRHQYGKMVSILTRIFGLQHLELIEDAVQDTFIRAVQSWKTQVPENPEAWLTKAAKNRVLDIFRKLQAEQKRIPRIDFGSSVIAIDDLFLDSEIEDSQLRMIFTACNPALNPRDQIAFSLKTISGFSSKEIASSLLLKQETVKKRLIRARKAIKTHQLSFEIPQGKVLSQRLDRVLEVIYLIFNEGFHSNKKEILIREDLCGEAMRLCKMLLKNTLTASPSTYALLALLCFQSARLKSKINDQDEIISLKEQDRSLWYQPLVAVGHSAMHRAVETEAFSSYHFEAAIAAEHIAAKTYEDTDWDKILMWYKRLHELEPNSINRLNRVVVHIQRKDFSSAQNLLHEIDPTDLEQRRYLYYGAYSEFYKQKGQIPQALEHIEKAISLVNNQAELKYLQRKKAELLEKDDNSS